MTYIVQLNSLETFDTPEFEFDNFNDFSYFVQNDLVSEIVYPDTEIRFFQKCDKHYFDYKDLFFVPRFLVKYFNVEKGGFINYGEED